ncbi:MAG: hypothetical protein EBZ47_07480 [Chlamydiae bacterium]|nr:hypothetical protein [Chlamydiota bacterium]
MSEILLREYLKIFLTEKGIARASTSGKAIIAFKILRKYLKGIGRSISLKEKAPPGSNKTDLKVALDGDDEIFGLEVKSFNSIDSFKIEMTADSAVRKAVLKRGSTLGTSQDVMVQMIGEDGEGGKLKDSLKAREWAKMAVQQPEESIWRGTIVVPGSAGRRQLKMLKGEIGDWTRIRARSVNPNKFGNWRDIYSVPNEQLALSSFKKISPKSLASAIIKDFTSKGDDVLILHAGKKLRCYSLTQRGFDSFGFPMFSEKDIINSSTTSFGGGGRISVIVQVTGGFEI